jgi:hypothetical protein
MNQWRCANTRAEIVLNDHFVLWLLIGSDGSAFPDGAANLPTEFSNYSG